MSTPAPTSRPAPAPRTRLEYQLRFLTPAFLGDANQAAEWRTPPFKALLRQWWRVAYAQDHDFRVDVNRMREAEGRLFGSAAGEQGNQSVIRLRLDAWQSTTLPRERWQTLGQIGEGKVKVEAGLYLGYGPISQKDRKPETGREPLSAFADQPSAQRSLVIHLHPRTRAALLDEEFDRLHRAAAWIDRFGTMGGRSRNGWGSLSMKATDMGSAIESGLPLRRWQDALQLDWPHAIGSDKEGALVWDGPVRNTWRESMLDAARIRLAARKLFRLDPNSRDVQLRHWLSYPLMKPRPRDWDNTWRLPNSLRIKVVEKPGGFAARIFHMPCRPPAAFIRNPEACMRALDQVWNSVHRFLDGVGPSRPVNLTRVPR